MSAEISVPQKNLTFHVFLNRPESCNFLWTQILRNTSESATWPQHSLLFGCYLQVFMRLKLALNTSCSKWSQTQPGSTVPKITQGAAGSAKGALQERGDTVPDVVFSHPVHYSSIATALIPPVHSQTSSLQSILILTFQVDWKQRVL